ncbi:hypothetical protein FACS1894202_00310 [Clostridia bacterium]|nr:hypothetical protein FACS1894202_00310 [Clostridia bacterium]
MKFQNKTLAMIAVLVFVVPLFVFGVWSVADTDPTRSETENREIHKPEFSWAALFAGTYTQEVAAYYADTFPLRETLMAANKALNAFYQGEGDVIIDRGDVEPGEGDSIMNVPGVMDDVTIMPGLSPSPEASPSPEPAASESSLPVVTETPTPSPTPEPTPEVTPTPDAPTAGEVVKAGNVVVIGTRAMEVSYANQSALKRYAKAISDIAAEMPNTRTIVLDVPNGAEFYTPEEMHTGTTSQAAQITSVYAQLDPSVVSVDGYGKIARHTDEYIYFRTDHHWTALGAYYAYTAFCEITGVDAVPLDAFETGEYTGFVGSMYNFTAKYAVSKVLKDNPDTLTYYLPVVEATMRIYSKGSLTGEYFDWSVVNTKMGSYGNKYVAFIGGDNPLTHIRTSAGTGKSIVVIKESYGNAFTPFLTSHYDDIYVIDPRKVNGDGQAKLKLPQFALDQAIDDVIFINYPMMINNDGWCKYLERMN